jgi:hypothetical protein
VLQRSGHASRVLDLAGEVIAHVGLPEGYRGAAGLLVAAPRVDLGQLGEAVAVEPGRIRP